MISHACSYAAGFGFALSLTRGLRLESDLKVGTYLPLIYHVGDQPFTYSVFLCGGTLVLGRGPSPERIAEMIDEERVTALWAGSPAMVRALDAVLTARPDLDARSLTVIVYGWAALPPATLAAKRTAYLSRPGLFDEAERIWAPVYHSADAQEGPAAFRDKRPPVWTGR